MSWNKKVIKCTENRPLFTWQQIIKCAGVSNSSDFQKMEKDKQRETLRTLLETGASVRQLQRLTGLGRGIIQRV